MFQIFVYITALSVIGLICFTLPLVFPCFCAEHQGIAWPLSVLFAAKIDNVMSEIRKKD